MNSRRFILTLVIVSLCGLIPIQPAHASAASDVEAPLYLDVRTRAEFERGHIPGAIHIPLREIRERIGELIPDTGRTILVYCDAGVRSALALFDLGQLGYDNARNAGGYAELLEAGAGTAP